jgi:mRNA interferase MazF
VGMVIQRFDVYLISLDPTVGSEIQKTRPCVIVSPDELNRHIATVIIAPMTSVGRSYPTRIACHFQDKEGQVVLDQLRTVDKTRLVKRLGRLTEEEQKAVLAGLAELFSA